MSKLPLIQKLGKRVVVVGTSGSGKTTLSRFLAAQLNVPHIELDAYNHGPNWTETPRDVFLQNVKEATDFGGWVVDGNYSHCRSATWDRADSLVWIDLSFAIVFSRVVRRTFRRTLKREVLWNGNRERLWPQFFSRDSLFLWVITTHSRRRRDFEERMKGPLGEKIIRLRSRKEVKQFMSEISRSDSSESARQAG